VISQFLQITAYGYGQYKRFFTERIRERSLLLDDLEKYTAFIH